MKWDSEAIIEVREYSGEAVVRLNATQLGTDFTQSHARRVVTEWVEFFSAGPSPIKELRLVTRTPKRLFAALRSQTQLEVLSVKWGDFEDLSVLEGLTKLKKLRLAGASSVRTLAPLAKLQHVEDLMVESLRWVRDLSPIGQMTAVTSLELGGNWMTPRVARVDSIGFLRQMPQLRTLVLHTIVADDLDYTPLLALPNLESVRVMAAKGMNPAEEDLQKMLPWSG